MSVTNRKLTILILIVALTLLALPMAARGRAVGVPSAPSIDDPVKKWVFESNQLEFYLGDSGIAYIRPGVKVNVVSITNVAPGQKPKVEVTFTDDLNQPLDRLGQITPGPIGISFILAWYNQDTREYTAYTVRSVTAPANSPNPGAQAIQASADSGGTWTDLELGHAIYTFRTAVPADADMTRTHTLGIYGSRNLSSIIDKTYYVNVEKDFRPDGGVIEHTWNKISTATCNNCHDPLSAHGGSRRDLKLCVLCHSDQTVDPDSGHSMDMETLVHKLHAGEHLSQPYVIIGFNQSVHDYSNVVFPQDLRNCDNCHEGITPQQKTNQSHVWYTFPSKDACFTCHDSINIETGEGHPGGAQTADCESCHTPDSGAEFDASILGAHTIPEKSDQLAGLNVEIVSVANMQPGKTPTVAFAITNDDGTPVDGSKLSTFAPILAGPTSSYSKMFREAAPARAVFDPVTGQTLFTFNAMIPEDATGTWTISGDFYRNATIQRAVPDGTGATTITLREAAFNPIHYVALDGGTAEPRRQAVTTAMCNTCHDRLALHGGQRMNIDECVICHNPTGTDTARRPADALPPESISFQYMVHKIHRGHSLTRDFTVYGFGGTPHNYNEVGFPGDLRNCSKCHVGDSYMPPASGDAVLTPRDYFSPMGSATAACLACHDSRDAAAHAFLNTTTFFGQPAEACGACHDADSTWSAEKVHAR